eukprot:6468358-Amphidinium_carterae.1
MRLGWSQSRCFRQAQVMAVPPELLKAGAGAAAAASSSAAVLEDVEPEVVDGDQEDEAVEIMEADFYDVAPPQAQRLLALRLVYGVTAPSV